MMLPLLVLIQRSRKVHGIPLEKFYTACGVTRQALHRHKQRQMGIQTMMQKVEQLVAAYRRDKDRRAGSRSLFYNLDIKACFGIGVNKFERLMAQYNLTLAPLRVRVVTTKSCLQSWNYQNLIHGLELRNINELVVGDLTYVQIAGQRYYLFCLTDVYSARIVGHCFYKRMRSAEALQALHKWITLRGSEAIGCCIHHTDGGTQYFSSQYINELMQCDLRVSVARSCLDNGYAEQRNGFIKQHLLPLLKFTEERSMYQQVDQILHVYNFERKQQKLGWLTPVAYERAIQTQPHRKVMKLHDPNAE